LGFLVFPLRGEAPKFRLGDAVTPARYRLELTLVPFALTFSGAVAIDLQLHSAVTEIWLSSQELTIRDATLTAGNDTLPAHIVSAGNGLAGFAFERAIQPGSAALHIKFEGRLNSSTNVGLFNAKEGDDSYIFSQFQPFDARRAFPCFDEPSFKAPWQITLHVKSSHTALSNAPVVSEVPEPGGMKAVRFAETKPLPTYLVAMAVGPFDLVEAGSAGRKRTRIRIIAPRGKSSEAAYAKENSARILEELENYFGTPYPYEKLDCIAVPLLGFAMENAGLITFDQAMILVKPGEDSVQHQRGYTSLAAHEFAHQWFGGLVTPAWWDDLWLNESFATWMTYKVLGRMKPEWKSEVVEVQSRSAVMSLDSMTSARKIRQPVESEQDMADAFNDVTYTKGATVIHMFENWLGPEKFQSGIRLYLERHAWGNASAADFLAAISAVNGIDVAPAFSSFLNQPGAPLVSAALKCDGQPRLALTQQRAVPLGSQNSSDLKWQIPVCARFGDTRQCALMTDVAFELPLKRCPDWVLADDGERGYYRVLYQGDLLERLLQENGEKLTLAERAGVLSDVEQLARLGKIPGAQALALVPRFRRVSEREILEVLSEITDLPYKIIPGSLGPNYSRFIRQMFGERARELGWQPRPGESEDIRLLRTTLVPLVTIDGEDRALIGEATRLVRRWLQDRRAIEPNLAGVVLRAAAKYGDKDLFQKLYAAAKLARNPEEKQELVKALGGFRDPALAKSAMELTLGNDFDGRDAMDLLLGPTANLTTRDLPFRFVQEHYDALLTRMPGSGSGNLAAALPNVAKRDCDEEHRAETEAFFKDRAAKVPEEQKILAQVLDQVRLCSMLRAAQLPGVAEFLKKY
jgi:alanyl aminopeptidase